MSRTIVVPCETTLKTPEDNPWAGLGAGLERQLQSLFKEVLNKDVSVTANFFAEGGTPEQVSLSNGFRIIA